MIHMKLWTGSRSARITDMTNAGKRGKVCRILRVSGTPWQPGNYANLTTDQQNALDWSDRVFSACYVISRGCDSDGQILHLEFDQVTAPIRALVTEARASGIPEWACAAYDETCKGIHAPRPILTAGVSGKWGASANETGISLRQYDDVNEWSQITPHDQTGPRAYELAAKVWDRVKACDKMSQAADILQAAGCRLHGYCAMD